MGVVRTWSVALLGVQGHVVEIEADVGGGLPRFQLVGLPDAALHEAKDRVRAAVTNSGRNWPNERIVLALSPASLRKAGSGFDLSVVKPLYSLSMSRRAAVYCRISRDQAGAGLGIERQEADCRELAERLGWQVVAVHSDNDISAFGGKRRPGYEALMEQLQTGDADAVIAWHPDRLHRRPVELESFIEVCEAHSVAVQTVRAGEVDLSTPSGKAVARTIGAWARHEVEHSTARIRRSKQQAAAAGAYRGGRRPYGYESDGVTPRESEATVVRDVTHRILVGESILSIMRDLNARGITTSTGGQWRAREVRRLVTRARNAALIEHNGAIVGDATWPAIVDRDTWHAARAVLDDPTRRPHPITYQEKWLGSGLYLCGVCGSTMLSANQKSGNGIRPGYVCKGGPHLTRVAEPVDDLVTRVALGRLSEPDARLLLRPTAAVDVPALQDKATALRGRLDELSGLFAAGDITGQQLRTGSERIRADLAAVECELAAAVGSSPLAGFADAASLGELTTAWEAATLGRRKAIVRELMTVTLLKAPRGRQPGGAYFDPRYIQITPIVHAE